MQILRWKRADSDRSILQGRSNHVAASTEQGAK